eukprot:6239705-Amphidinium_carterae.1
MMTVLPKSPNEELETEKRAVATEFFNKEPCIKEAGQEHADLVKYHNDTANLYYFQDKKDIALDFAQACARPAYRPGNRGSGVNV